MLSNSANKSLDYMKNELRGEAYMKGIDDQPTWTPIFVPNLVHQLLDKKIQYAFRSRNQTIKLITHSIARISHILGYKNAHVFGEQPRVNQWRYIQRLPSRASAETRSLQYQNTAEDERPVRDAIQ